MKTLAFTAALLLLASCASNDGFIDNQTNQCAEGSEIELQAGFSAQSTPSDRINRIVTMIVEVTNLSDAEVTLKNVRADAAVAQGRFYAYELEGGSRDVAAVLPEGESTIVEIPMRVRIRNQNSGAQDIAPADPNREFSAEFDVAVTAQLEGGASYRCRFRMPANF